jgi:tyrosyl-DNA phosphodiesterase 1
VAVGVRRLLQHLKAPASDHPLICQFSSMGSLDEKWLFGEFALSLMPGSFTQLASGTALPIKAFHIIWPAVEDIVGCLPLLLSLSQSLTPLILQRNSIEGWNGGRAVPCPLKNMKPFLHKYLRKWTPPDALHRQNAMPHIKTYARFNPTQSGQLDYAILTSSNLSKAAWGALQKNKTQLMIRSYELGVLFLPRPTASSSPPQLAVVGSQAARDESTPRLLLPLPYGFPLKTYNPKQDEPWVWDLVRESPDVFGNCYIPR